MLTLAAWWFLKWGWGIDVVFSIPRSLWNINKFKASIALDPSRRRETISWTFRSRASIVMYLLIMSLGFFSTAAAQKHTLHGTLNPEPYTLVNCDACKHTPQTTAVPLSCAYNIIQMIVSLLSISRYTVWYSQLAPFKMYVAIKLQKVLNESSSVVMMSSKMETEPWHLLQQQLHS